MAIKKYSTLPRFIELESHQQMKFSVLSKTSTFRRTYSSTRDKYRRQDLYKKGGQRGKYYFLQSLSMNEYVNRKRNTVI